MAHHQRAVAAAVILNTGIFGVELVAGWQASSLSLMMDGVHNFSGVRRRAGAFSHASTRR